MLLNSNTNEGMNDSHMREVFVVFQTAQRRVSSVTHALLPSSEEGPVRTFTLAAASRLLSCKWRLSSMEERSVLVQRWNVGMSCHSELCRTGGYLQACFPHLGLGRKSDSSV